MKHYSKWLLGAMAAGLFAACSNDVINPDSGKNHITPEEEGDGVYMSVNVNMPNAGAGTRSYTDGDNSSNSGTEVGKDYENNVNTVYLVLAKATDNTFIAWGEIPAAGIVKNTTGSMYTSKAKFSKSQLAAYYGSDVNAPLEDTEVNVFVFCNPTLALRQIFEDAELKTEKSNTWVNSVGEYDASNSTSEVIWSENNFLMSNNSLAIRSLPKTLAAWDAFTEENKPFELSGPNAGVADCDNSANANRGAVNVERTAARFDFRDASPEFEGKGDATNLYQVVWNDDSTHCYVNIKLNKMSLTNMNKQFYYLRRVSDDGLNQNLADPNSAKVEGWKLCGPELPWFTSSEGGLVQNKDGNYVVNPLAQLMRGPILSDFSNYFNYPFFSPEGTIDNPTITDWYTSVTDDVIKGTSDEFGDKNYHIWRYVIPNTIPGIEDQKNGQSTGVIFKGKMIATDEAMNSEDENIRELAHIINNEPMTEGGTKPLTGDLDKDPILYKFKSVKNNVGGVYATWENVQKAAKASAITPVWEADNTPAGGYWRLDINRSAPLFHAVYGNNGSCGSYTFTTTSGDTVTVDDPLILRDAEGNPILNADGKEQPAWNEDSPNYKWMLWNAAGRPIPQSPTVQPEDAKLYYDFKAAAVDANITLYQTSYDGNEDYGYYCYYYYWNRHNDNGLNGIMGPMEFAVVRNNVYKLAVTAIKDLGHPRFTENDPNKPTPDTDDEIDDVYITVNVDVLPWVVRVNNTVF